MLVNQMYTGHRGKGQEYSLGVPRSACESGVKFLHWILFRIDAHLGKISASYNILRVIVFWLWLVALGAILYQMPGLHLKTQLYNTVGFPWLYLWHLLYGGIVALWSEAIGIHIGDLGSSHTGLDLYLFFWGYVFLVLLILSVISWLVGRKKRPLGFSQVWVSLLFVQTLMRPVFGW
jgi:hypothetical protein